MTENKDSQMPLFEPQAETTDLQEEKMSKDGPWYIVQNRFAFLHCLAGYAVFPGQLVKEFLDPFNEKMGGALLCFKGKLPASVVEKVADGNKARFPVLFELDSKLADRVRPLLDSETGTNFGQLDGPIPFRFVSSVVFQSEEQLEDVKVRSFDDVDVDAKPFVAMPGLFSDDEFDAQGLVDSVVASNLEEQKWFHVDKVCGGVAALMQAIPSQSQFFEGFSKLLEVDSFIGFDSDADKYSAAFCELLKPNHYSESEQKLLAASIRAFATVDPKTGWIPSTLLEEIHSFLGNAGDTSADLERWYKSCVDILSEKSDVHPLTDERNVVQRGVLLALLREHPEDVIASDGAFFRPGPIVRAVGTFLAGVFRGFRGLSSKFKQPPAFASHLGSLFCVVGHPETLPLYSDINVAYESVSTGRLENTIKLAINDEVILQSSTKSNPEIRMFGALGEHMGLDFELVDPRTIKCDLEFKDGHNQPVYIRFIFESWNGGRIARFLSPCASLTKVIGGVSKDEQKAKLVKSKSKIVSREQIIELLFQQSRENFNCRFAIDSELEALVVMADQIIETIDQAEFKSHVEHVASAAKNFMN